MDFMDKDGLHGQFLTHVHCPFLSITSTLVHKVHDFFSLLNLAGITLENQQAIVEVIEDKLCGRGGLRAIESYLSTIWMKMATPEKAIVDFCYFRPARSKLFRALPELELPSNFNLKLAKTYIEKIHSKSRRTLVSQLLKDLLR